MDIQAMFKEIEEEFQTVVEWRRHLHQHPELSFQEQNTAAFITDKLTSFGLEVRTGIGGYGIVAVLKGGEEGKRIALRADFDALPIADEKEVPYKSRYDGVMHACGHDGHTAALLGTAKVLSRYRDQLKGTIHFIFQPAEELPPGGAKAMIEEGILDEVDAVFAIHLATDVPVGKIAVGAGYQMAAVDKFDIVIHGKGGHGARPHEAIDSIVIGSELVGALQKIVSRRINPLQAGVVTVGQFHAGSAFNVIADTARLEGTVRSFDEGVRDLIEEEIRSIVDGIVSGAHASYSIDYLRGYPALFNHKEATEETRRLLAESFGEDAMMEMEPSMGAEDFAYFLKEKPGTYFKVGARNEHESTQYPHHHPKFDFDEQALLIMQKAFIEIVRGYALLENEGE
ncbi:amidohydrolase [Paenibacillus campinasensis]|uniref:Amidohydrolase n=1 Tax=Paenibacillus campinasensis TaxID=66347 RepID=A0ABW9SWB6_9BACL|nr:M20 family metallopeptidase [Paenibacillus campinasensis]MUG65298.1 amidohydrolase [Paenibacillus campinasensis]